MFNKNYGVFSVLKNFAKFTGKHLCQSLFFNKAKHLRPGALYCKFLILILRKKNTQNEHIIAHFVYFFTCHYSKTVWLAENLNERKITHYEKIFSHIKQKFSHFEKELGTNNFFLSH